MSYRRSENGSAPRRPTSRPSVKDTRRPSTPLLGALAAVAVIAIVFVGVGIALSGKPEPQEQPAANQDVRKHVSFVAVGDNTPNETIGYYADSLAGTEGDGTYDYTPIYKDIAPYIQEADLAYVNEETHLGGNEIGPRGYPSFNTTDEMADAVVATGFDLVALANNHSYDWGPYGALEHNLEMWEKQPVTFTGTSVTEEQYNRIATRECNGITFALLDYTYGVNGYTEDELPKHSINFIDDERITSDVGRAKEEADVVLVAMHWGIENEVEASDEQVRLAQLLADLDVDVVIGSHPHVIQPMEWVENSSGSGHKTLVAYSVGNFLIDHEAPLPDNGLEGMLSCDFYKQDSGEIAIENVKFTPLICHVNTDRTAFGIYTVDDYTEKLASENRNLETLEGNRVEWLRNRAKEIVGSEWF